MKILGVDYGRRKVGLAISESFLAEPLSVVKVKSVSGAVEKVAKVVEVEEVDMVVVGVSEGLMAKESESFAEILRKQLTIPVKLHDETLTSNEAQKKSIEAGINRKKRKKLEDAYAAAILLQDYLDLKSNF